MNNTKNSWNGIDNLINCKKKQSKVISSLKRPSDNSLPIEISNILNKYFSSIGGSLASHVPSLRIVLLTKYLSPSDPNSFFCNINTLALVLFE